VRRPLLQIDVRIWTPKGRRAMTKLALFDQNFGASGSHTTASRGYAIHKSISTKLLVFVFLRHVGW
jgi:hypothetical protein